MGLSFLSLSLFHHRCEERTSGKTLVYEFYLPYHLDKSAVFTVDLTGAAFLTVFLTVTGAFFTGAFFAGTAFFAGACV